MLQTYLPAVIATCAIVYLRADGWSRGSSGIFWIAAGLFAFAFCFAFALGEWKLREFQFRLLCEHRREPFEPME